MNMLKFSATLVLAYWAVAVAGNESEFLIQVWPITRAQYESVMRISGGQPLVTEGRLIGSAISGLAGLAAGFQISKYLPNILSADSQSSKGSAVLGGYPLCTINTNDATGRQYDAGAYLNIDELTNSLVQTNAESSNLSTMKCILVLDDGNEKPLNENTDQTESLSTTGITSAIMSTTYKPIPHYHSPPAYWPYNAYYPGSPYYAHPYYPYSMSNSPHIRYNMFEQNDDNESETNHVEEPSLSLDPAANLQTLITRNQQTNSRTKKPSIKTTARTTKKPSKNPTIRSTKRPPSRPHYKPQSPPRHNSAKSERQKLNDNFNEYDDSTDYIEVSRKSYH